MFISTRHAKSVSNDDTINLIFFPPAGTLASSILRLFDTSTLKGYDLHVFEYPGRGVAIGESPINRFDDLCISIHRAVQPLLNRPIILIGHSFGSYIALEISRLLFLRQKVVSSTVILSAIKNISKITDETFRLFLDKNDDDILDGIGLSIPDDYHAIKSNLIEWIRHDLSVLSTYRIKRHKYVSNLVILNGSKDQYVSTDNSYEDWSGLTTMDCKFIQLDTGHVFDDVYVKAIISAISN